MFDHPLRARLLLPFALGSLLAACSRDPGSGPEAPNDGVDWARTIGGPYEDHGAGIAVANSSIYVATDEEGTNFQQDIVLHRLESSGAEIWQQRWGAAFDDFAYCAVAGNGVIYVGGSTEASAGANANALVLAFDASSGALRWAYSFDLDHGYERIEGIAVENDALYCTGWTESLASRMDVLALRLSLDGTQVWSSHWGSSGFDVASGQPVALGGLVYVAGRYNANSASSGGDALLAAFSQASGDPVWYQVSGDGQRREAAFDLASDGFNLYLVGAASTARGTDLRLWGYSSSGFLLWQHDWGGRGEEFGYGVTLDRFDGSLYATGQTTTLGAGGSDLVLLRFDRDGAVQDTLVWGGANDDLGDAVVAATDAIYVVGDTESYGQGGSDAAVLRVR